MYVYVYLCVVDRALCFYIAVCSRSCTVCVSVCVSTLLCVCVYSAVCSRSYTVCMYMSICV